MAYTELNALYDRVFNRFENEDLISKAEVLQMIANAPRADVAEVVRCKDCNGYDKHRKHCNYCGILVFDDDFCSYGARKEGVDNGN